MKAILKVYDKCKYNAEANWHEAHVLNITDFEVKRIPKKVILKETSEDCVDDNNEYLILHFENGETGTYRNSYVDLYLYQNA